MKPEAQQKAPAVAQDAKGGAVPASSPVIQAVHSLAEWDKSKLPWNETPQGRLQIRSFSRGILGAAAFAWGGWYASKEHGLRGYEFFSDVEKNTPYLRFVQENIKYPLNIVARSFDEFAGRPIKWAVEAITHNPETAEKAVRFRPMSLKFSGRFNKTGGRSLGEEAVGITFDFFCASIGDALGRDLADLEDKNIKKKWIDDKTGDVKPVQALQSLGKTLWRYATYNGGEDWAVALPYAYFMKAQRAVLNKVSPGFKFDANESLNGAAFKVNDEAKIIGNYNAVGAFDLQSRFTVYNIGTLMYREAYDWAAQALKGKPINIYGDPYAKHQNRELSDNVADVAKWAARSAVKGFLTMTPAVPFFWITRTPQTKYKATFINPENQSMLTYSLGNQHAPDKPQYGLVKGLLSTRHIEGGSNFTPDAPVGFRKYTGVIDPVHSPNGWKAIGTPSVGFNPLYHGFDPHDPSHSKGIVSGVMNGVGRVNDDLRRSVRSAFDPYIPPKDMARFVNASISYTPYMFAKAETARLFDTGKMDLATERMIDGAAKLNFSEFKEGLGEVWRSVLQQPLKDPKREAEALRRITLDTSAADADATSSAEDHKRLQEEEAKRKQALSHVREDSLQDMVTHTPAERAVKFGDKFNTQVGAITPANQFAGPTHTHYHDQLSWQDRLIQGRKPSEKQNVYEDAKNRPPVSHADKQRMQEILAAAVPPTNSKH